MAPRATRAELKVEYSSQGLMVVARIRLLKNAHVVDVVCRSKYCRGSSLDINIFGGEGEGLKNQRGDAIDGVPHMG